MKPPAAVLRALGLRALPDAPAERAAVTSGLRTANPVAFVALVAWAHAEASRVADPPSPAAWAAVLGVTRGALFPWRRDHEALGELPVAAPGRARSSDEEKRANAAARSARWREKRRA